MKAELLQLAHDLKNEGFTVIVPTEKDGKHYNWFKFTDGKNFASVSDGICGGLSYSRVHKPNKDSGTGVMTSPTQCESASLELAKQALKYPDWFRPNITPVQYTSVEDFINASHNKWCNYTIL